MSRLPEKGDATRAVTQMGARSLLATRPDGSDDFGEVSVSVDGRAEGDGMDMYRKVYSDLFDMGEMVSAARGLMDQYVEHVENGPGEIRDALFSAFLQGVGVGVLQERGRR